MPRIDLPSDPEAPALGLRALDGWLAGLDPALADRVTIAAGELLGNTVAHGPGGTFTLEWIEHGEGGSLRILGGGAVTPDAIAEAHLPGPEATRGRGLYILRAISDTLALDADGALRLDFRP